MRTLLALTWIAMLGCGRGRSDRDVDCAKVRDIVDSAIDGVPRRYRDEALRERARARLTQLDYADPAIERAALDPQLTYDQIEQLCTPGTPSTSSRERDCAAVRAQLPQLPFGLMPDRATGRAIRDERTLAALERRVYEDPAVKQVVVDMIRATGAAFFTPAESDVTTVDTRARAAYDKLASLCELPPLT